jgi:hypothetical protein
MQLVPAKKDLVRNQSAHLRKTKTILRETLT